VFGRDVQHCNGRDIFDDLRDLRHGLLLHGWVCADRVPGRHVLGTDECGIVYIVHVVQQRRMVRGGVLDVHELSRWHVTCDGGHAEQQLHNMRDRLRLDDSRLDQLHAVPGGDVPELDAHELYHRASRHVRRHERRDDVHELPRRHVLHGDGCDVLRDVSDLR